MIGQLNLERALKVNGWMSIDELSYLAEVAQECKIIFEVGSYCGKSARVMADNSSDECKIYCIDPWDFVIMNTDHTMIIVDDTAFAQFHAALYDHIKTKKIIACPMKYEKFKLPEDISKADFIFIDGDHSYGAVIYDIVKSITLLKPGGILAGHDYNWDTVKRAVDQYFPNSIEVIDTIWTVRI